MISLGSSMGPSHTHRRVLARTARFLILLCFLSIALGTLLFVGVTGGTSESDRWKITSIRICRDYRGNLIPHVEALGSYPVYSFFIPRPVWTVNGTAVEAQPIYDRGRLVAFKLLYSAHLMKSKAKNTVKFSLPDQNGAKVFRYDKTKLKAAECYEFF